MIRDFKAFQLVGSIRNRYMPLFVQCKPFIYFFCLLNVPCGTELSRHVHQRDRMFWVKLQCSVVLFKRLFCSTCVMESFGK